MAIRLAMLGCGGIMGKHARAVEQLDGVEVVGLCDVADANMDKLIAAHFGAAVEPPPKFSEPAAMYEQVKPDAVVIASPHTLHYEQACEALERGCHILMEKPMVTDLGEAVDLARRVEDSGKVFCIAYNTPCTAELYTLRQMIRREDLGRLKVVSMHLTQPWYRNTRGKWRQDPSLSGGGQLYDSGAHPLCSLCWTVDNDVAEVSAYIDRLDSPVDINGVVNVKFADGGWHRWPSPVKGRCRATGRGSSRTAGSSSTPGTPVRFASGASRPSIATASRTSTRRSRAAIARRSVISSTPSSGATSRAPRRGSA